MKHQAFQIPSNENPDNIGLKLRKMGMVAAQAALIGFGAIATPAKAQDGGDDQGAQVLTRGPVHEAFAGTIVYNPEPGVIVQKAPPEVIEEMPPEERPAGENITWIPGYWAWDDERGDYLWISGTWRALPPGRQWTTGYWNRTDDGYQWISGYWADTAAQETTYLPKPPATVESGPNIAAPSRDHGWTPGCWVWQQERYIWRPGYWTPGRAEWVWIPAHYVWTPRGYVFVEGYWDYSYNRRGVVYAPVYFQSGYYSRPGYSYSPVIAIAITALVDNLFLRPRYHHYYFGDYYDRGCRDRGYYSPYYYQSNRYGYDPVYSYRRWSHRDDRDWERRYIETYDYRRNHESARPPRTWADQKKLKLATADAKQQQFLMAAPLDEMAKREDSTIRVEKVPQKERQQLADMGREVRKNRDQRKSLETEGVIAASDKDGRDIKPTKAKLPASPIVGRSPDRFSKKDAPPKPLNTPIAESKKDEPERKPGSDQPKRETKDQPGPRGPETTKKQDKPQEKSERQVEKPQKSPAQEQKKPQAEPERPVEKPQKAPAQEKQSKKAEQPREPQQEIRRKETVPQIKKPQPEPERRVQKPTRQESPTKTKEPQRTVPQEPRQSGRESPTRTSGPSRSKDSDNRSKDDSEESGKGKKK